MIEWWGPVINEYYGATETGIVTSGTIREEWLAHPGTVGKPIAGRRACASSTSEGSDCRRARSARSICADRFIADFTYHSDDAEAPRDRRTAA